MAWAYIQDNDDISLADYDRVAAEIGSNPPKGLILHVAGAKGNGFRVIDVWESEEAYNRFRNERLLPAIEKAIGREAIAEGPPPMEPLHVHNIIRGA